MFEKNDKKTIEKTIKIALRRIKNTHLELCQLDNKIKITDRRCVGEKKM